MKKNVTDKVIILYKGPSQYGVLRNMMDMLAIAFEQLGYEVIVFDYQRKPIELIEIIKRKKVFFVFDFNGLGLVRKLDNLPVINYIDVPYVIYLVDSPIHHFNLLTTEIKKNNIYICMVDETHVEITNKYITSKNNIAYLPQFTHYNIKNLKPIKKRNLNLVFTGTAIDPEQIRKNWKNYNHEKYETMNAILEEAIYENEKDLLEIAIGITSHLYKGSVDLELISMLSEIDKYIRQYRRKEIILKLANIPINIYGNGWDYLQRKNNKLRIFKGGSAQETFEIMKNSKLVLNVMPNWTNGPHERMLNTMMCGAVSLTDSNRHLKKHFKHEDKALFYDYKDNYLEEKVHLYINDTDKLQEIANNGRNEVVKNYTVLNYAKKLIEIISNNK